MQTIISLDTQLFRLPASFRRIQYGGTRYPCAAAYISACRLESLVKGPSPPVFSSSNLSTTSIPPANDDERPKRPCKLGNCSRIEIGCSGSLLRGVSTAQDSVRPKAAMQLLYPAEDWLFLSWGERGRFDQPSPAAVRPRRSCCSAGTGRRVVASSQRATT